MEVELWKGATENEHQMSTTKEENPATTIIYHTINMYHMKEFSTSNKTKQEAADTVATHFHTYNLLSLFCMQEEWTDG